MTLYHIYDKREVLEDLEDDLTDVSDTLALLCENAFYEDSLNMNSFRSAFTLLKNGKGFLNDD